MQSILLASQVFADPIASSATARASATPLTRLRATSAFPSPLSRPQASLAIRSKATYLPAIRTKHFRTPIACSNSSPQQIQASVTPASDSPTAPRKPPGAEAPKAPAPRPASTSQPSAAPYAPARAPVPPFHRRHWMHLTLTLSLQTTPKTTTRSMRCLPHSQDLKSSLRANQCSRMTNCILDAPRLSAPRCYRTMSIAIGGANSVSHRDLLFLFRRRRDHLGAQQCSTVIRHCSYP